MLSSFRVRSSTPRCLQRRNKRIRVYGHRLEGLVQWALNPVRDYVPNFSANPIRPAARKKMAGLRHSVDCLPYSRKYAETSPRHCLSHCIAIPTPRFNRSGRCLFCSGSARQTHLLPANVVDDEWNFRSKHGRRYDRERLQILSVHGSDRHADHNRWRRLPRASITRVAALAAQAVVEHTANCFCLHRSVHPRCHRTTRRQKGNDALAICR